MKKKTLSDKLPGEIEVFINDDCFEVTPYLKYVEQYEKCQDATARSTYGSTRNSPLTCT